MRCKDCDLHVDDRHGEDIINAGDKHWLHLPSVANERLCYLEGLNKLFLVGSFAIGTDGANMEEHKHPLCPYNNRRS